MSGRLVLGVGSGAFPFEWDYCGEEPDPRVRGAMLDEHLELLAPGHAARDQAGTGELGEMGKKREGESGDA